MFSSDLGRAQDTLCQIGYKTADKFDRRLRERDYGAWSGKPWIEYKNATKCSNGTSTEYQHLPGVETDDKLQKRFDSILHIVSYKLLLYCDFLLSHRLHFGHVSIGCIAHIGLTDNH